MESEARIKKVLGRWPVVIEMETSIVEKEVDSITQEFLRYSLRCQGSLFTCSDVPLSLGEDRVFYDEAIVAGHFVQYCADLFAQNARALLKEGVLSVAGTDEQIEQHIEEFVALATSSVRARLGKSQGGSEPVMDLGRLPFHYKRIYPAILESVRAAKEHDRSSDPQKKANWKSAAQDAWKGYSINQFGSGSNIGDLYGDLPDDVLTGFRARGAETPSKVALRLSARACLNSPGFGSEVPYTTRRLWQILQDHIKKEKIWTEWKQKAPEISEYITTLLLERLENGETQK